MRDYLATLLVAAFAVFSFVIVGHYKSEQSYQLAGYWFGLGLLMACLFLARLLEISNRKNK